MSLENADKIPNLVECGRLLLESPPPPESDELILELFNNPASLVHLPTLARPGGWTIADVQQRREAQTLGKQRLESWNCVVWLKQPQTASFNFSSNVDSNIQPSHNASDFVGISGLRSIDLDLGECEAGIMINPCHQRRGFCSEALLVVFEQSVQHLGMQRVILRTSIANVPMRTFCERCEIAYEGEVVVDGGYVFAQYVLTAAQWPRTRQLLLESLQRHA